MADLWKTLETSFLDLHQQIDDAFDELVRRHFPKEAAAKWRPLVDIYELPDAYVVEIDLPGVTPEDLHLHAGERSLTISGERKICAPQGSLCDRCERPVGSFQRVIHFAKAIDAMEASAASKHGFYSIHIPKLRVSEETVAPSETSYAIRVTVL